MSTITLPLEVLIGDTSDISCHRYEMIFKNLKIVIWKYSCSNVPRNVPVVAVHGGPGTLFLII